MKSRRKHHNGDQTRNDRVFIVRYTYPTPQGRRTTDFHTSDKAQANRKARECAKGRCLVSFTRHVGHGSWTDLTDTVTEPPVDRLTRTFAPTQFMHEEVDAQ